MTGKLLYTLANSALGHGRWNTSQSSFQVPGSIPMWHNEIEMCDTHLLRNFKPNNGQIKESDESSAGNTDPFFDFMAPAPKKIIYS